MEIFQIPIQTDYNQFVSQYVEVINGFLPSNETLTKGEREVLVEIIIKDDPSRKDMDRGSMILDYKTVKEPIMFKLHISQPRLANIISSLKKKNSLIFEDGLYRLHPIFENASHDILPFNLSIEWHDTYHQ